jgi:uncharacterized membrane protein
MELVVIILILALAAIPIMSMIALILAARCRRMLDLQRLELNELRRQVQAMGHPPTADVGSDNKPLPQARSSSMDFRSPVQTPPKPTTQPITKDPYHQFPSAPPLPETPAISPAPPEPSPAPPTVVRPKPEPVTQPYAAVPSRFSGFEQALGLRWTVWVGGMILFAGAGLFVKYAFEQSWLGPMPRVLLSLATGLALALAGERFIRRDMRALGQGLVGVGLAILYAALYGAYGYYHIMPQGVTFALMILVTAGGMLLAARHHALAISFLATLGGFLTPLMLSRGNDARDSLFAYLLVLDIGVLGMAIFKRWRALDVLAFLGTSALFAAWYAAYGHAYQAVLGTVLWLSAFYLVFLLVPFVYHLRTATCITGERFFLAVSNAVGLFGWTYTLLRPHHPHTLGLITLGMGLTYLALGLLTRQRIPEDRKGVLGFASLFMAFVIMAVPIHLNLQAVTVAWSVQAPLLLYLAYKYDYLPVRLGSLIPLVMSVARLFLFHWPLHSESFTLCCNTGFGTGLMVVLAGFAYALIHRTQRPSSTSLDECIGSLTALVSGLLTLILCHVELWQWLTYRGYPDMRLWTSALIWVLGAGAFAMAAQQLQSTSSFLAGLVPLGVAALLTLGAYLQPLLPPRLFLNGRFLAGLSITGMLFALGLGSQVWVSIKLPQRKRMTDGFLGIGIAAAAALLSAETWLWLDACDRQELGRSLLVVFTAGAAWAFHGVGARRASYELRMATVFSMLLAVVPGIWGYAYRIETHSQMILNLRFLAALLPVAIALVHVRTLQRQPEWLDPREKQLTPILYGGMAVFLFGLISLETYFHVSSWMTDHERARWLAQMALSLVWGGYATALLALGFRIPQAKLRLAALSLFGVTAVKLVLIDMAQVQDIFRIVSFVGLGVLMIGASYLYHRAVKKLATDSN